jgi:hypothetical protein
MRKFRMLAATLCAAVLMCSFSVTAYAGGGDEYMEDTGGYEQWEGLDPAEELPVETPEPELKPFTPSGTGTVVDNATDEDGKEFFTIMTPAENVFYLVIDRQRETENVFFLNAVTEADLLALAEMPAEPVPPAPDPEPADDPEPTEEPEPEQPKATGGAGMLLLALAMVGIGGGAGWYFKIYRPKKQRAAESEEDYGGEYDDFDGAAYDETAPEDDTPPWDEDGEE